MSRYYARRWFWSEYDINAYECPDCGRGRGRVNRFEVHHKDGDATNNNPENLIAVCRRCHSWRHNEGPTLKGLDNHEWKEAFIELGEGDGAGEA